MQYQSCHFANRCSMKKRNLSTMTSLTYSVKVFMSIQPAIVLTIISCSTPSSHQVSLRSFFFFLSRKPSKSNLTVIYKVKDHILILKKLSGLMFVMPKMI